MDRKPARQPRLDERVFLLHLLIQLTEQVRRSQRPWQRYRSPHPQNETDIFTEVALDDRGSR
jgi:hypothetical protein